MSMTVFRSHFGPSIAGAGAVAARGAVAAGPVTVQLRGGGFAGPLTVQATATSNPTLNPHQWMELGYWAWFAICLKRLRLRRYWFGAFGFILGECKKGRLRRVRGQYRERNWTIAESLWHHLTVLLRRFAFRGRLWAACGNWLNSIKKGERLED